MNQNVTVDQYLVQKILKLEPNELMVFRSLSNPFPEQTPERSLKFFEGGADVRAQWGISRSNSYPQREPHDEPVIVAVRHRYDEDGDRHEPIPLDEVLQNIEQFERRLMDHIRDIINTWGLYKNAFLKVQIQRISDLSQTLQEKNAIIDAHETRIRELEEEVKSVRTIEVAAEQ